MSESEARSSILRQSADAGAVEAIERLVREAPDRALSRTNLLGFAASNGLNEESAIAAYLHAARLGLFDLPWNILCPGCGGVLDSNATLTILHREDYTCALCAAGYEVTLGEMVEVCFTVNPRVRKIAAHDRDSLPLWEYSRQIFWSSGIELPEDDAFEELLQRIVLDSVELPIGEKAILSLQLPAEFIIVFDPVTHAAYFLGIKGEATHARQKLSVVFNNVRAPTGTVEMCPGPLRLVLESRSNVRVLPAVFTAGHDMHELLGRRKKFLTAKRLLTNQTFRDIHRTDTLDVDQRLKITRVTFLFTDLKGSTEIYERVGDPVAYDIVKAHFGVLTEVVAAEAGAVVKTIGDAVMATFSTPDRACRDAAHARGDAEPQCHRQAGRPAAQDRHP